MARIDSKVVFVTTSPRTPAKMVPEIALLHEHFAGQAWNHDTQCQFMELLKERDFFQGLGEKDPGFSARDRINRAPQVLGFVELQPAIRLTTAGKLLISCARTEEVFLRQLLKFQLPSAYHIPSPQAASFNIRPYLELFRLIRHLGSLTFDELKMFALQLTDYHDFNRIIEQIEHFRLAKKNHTGSYREFAGKCFDKELRKIYSEEITTGQTNTRESTDASVENFLRTKARNMRDYADAAFRYLRATGLVNIAYSGKAISLVAERIEDVDYFLEHTDREPVYVNDKVAYIDYLGNCTLPTLLTDNRDRLLDKLHKEFPKQSIGAEADVGSLNALYTTLIEQRKAISLEAATRRLKQRSDYNEVQELFDNIAAGKVYDAPLLLEWNTWRAMTMLDGGDIRANLRFDDFGKPLSTALGNQPDISCDYGDFALTVEVTLQAGQRQFETESESVARHLGRLKRETGKTAYCLFVAPTINAASVSFFFVLQKTNVGYYGGRSNIVPLPLALFRKMLEAAGKDDYVPQPEDVAAFFAYAEREAECSANENEWYEAVCHKASSWPDHNHS